MPERRVAAYPGTFDPPTLAHLAIAGAAHRQAGMHRVELLVSRAPLAKAPHVPSFEDRITVLEEVAAARDWLDVRVSDKRLIAELCRGYDAVVMGTDKWLQVLDPAWYGGSEERRDRAVSALPTVLLAVRAGVEVPGDLPPTVSVLDIHPDHAAVSSSLVRAGRLEWMLPEAAAFDRRTGAWSDPARYLRCHNPAGRPD